MNAMQKPGWTFSARYMSSAQGRFTSPDWSTKPEPIPYADLTDPQPAVSIRARLLRFRVLDVLVEPGELLPKQVLDGLLGAIAVRLIR